MAFAPASASTSLTPSTPTTHTPPTTSSPSSTRTTRTSRASFAGTTSSSAARQRPRVSRKLSRSSVDGIAQSQQQKSLLAIERRASRTRSPIPRNLSPAPASRSRNGSPAPIQNKGTSHKGASLSAATGASVTRRTGRASDVGLTAGHKRNHSSLRTASPSTPVAARPRMLSPSATKTITANKATPKSNRRPLIPAFTPDHDNEVKSPAPLVSTTYLLAPSAGVGADPDDDEDGEFSTIAESDPFSYSFSSAGGANGGISRSRILGGTGRRSGEDGADIDFRRCWSDNRSSGRPFMSSGHNSNALLDGSGEVVDRDSAYETQSSSSASKSLRLSGHASDSSLDRSGSWASSSATTLGSAGVGMVMKLASGVWNFCRASSVSFNGFHAGGGDGYNMTAPLSSDEPIDLGHETQGEQQPSHDDEPLLKQRNRTASAASRFYNLHQPETPLPPLSALRLRQQYSAQVKSPIPGAYPHSSSPSPSSPSPTVAAAIHPKHAMQSTPSSPSMTQGPQKRLQTDSTPNGWVYVEISKPRSVAHPSNIPGPAVTTASTATGKRASWAPTARTSLSRQHSSQSRASLFAPKSSHHHHHHHRHSHSHSHSHHHRRHRNRDTTPETHLDPETGERIIRSVERGPPHQQPLGSLNNHAATESDTDDDLDLDPTEINNNDEDEDEDEEDGEGQEEKDRMARLNSRLRDMIREGQAALSSGPPSPTSSCSSSSPSPSPSSCCSERGGRSSSSPAAANGVDGVGVGVGLGLGGGEHRAGDGEYGGVTRSGVLRRRVGDAMEEGW